MPDHRKHRGPHPEDTQLFRSDVVPALREAVGDLSWLLTRGYATVSAVKLVGDRYSLTARQRLAVSRCACSDDAIERRASHAIKTRELAGKEIWIDGYNVLTSVEAALSGGVILHARDGHFRDMASMHGSYRKVEETLPAIRRIGELLEESRVASATWLLDRPVSNSGRLKAILLEIASERSWEWKVDLVADPDPVLMQCAQIVASADSQILDAADRSFPLARTVIERHVERAWIIDLSRDGQEQAH